MSGTLLNLNRAFKPDAGRYGLSLKKRRAWFDEAGSVDEPEAEEQPVDIQALPSWAQGMISDLRREAAENRVKAKKAEEQRLKEEADRLAQQGEWQTLAEQRAQELERLKPVSEKAAALEAKIKASNDSRIQQLPEELRSVVPDFDDPVLVSEWLDANLSKLTARTAPALDGGVTGDRGGKGAASLTADELAAAKRMGISPELYAKYKGA